MPTSPELSQLREEYRLARLDESDCAANPVRQFESWFQEAKNSGLKEPNAMTLATADRHTGQPSARIVLLKGINEQDEFVFFTNYKSRKGQELAVNARCALVFYWAELERQVRVEGSVQKVSKEVSQAYFQLRPKGSRLGALISQQSSLLPSRRPLEERLKELDSLYANSDDVPMPAAWGGYRVKPEVLEFWQGRENRLHDRLLYRLNEQGQWQIGRLSP